MRDAPRGGLWVLWQWAAQIRKTRQRDQQPPCQSCQKARLLPLHHSPALKHNTNTLIFYCVGMLRDRGAICVSSQTEDVTLLKGTSATTVSGSVPRVHYCSRISLKFKIYTSHSSTVLSVGRKESQRLEFQQQKSFFQNCDKCFWKKKEIFSLCLSQREKSTIWPKLATILKICQSMEYQYSIQSPAPKPPIFARG